MNSISKHILNKHIKALEFKCGIGIDYGKMLIAKAGALRKGAETEFYRSLVWLGRPANIASRLTDIANKSTDQYVNGVQEGYYYDSLKEWLWLDKTYDAFIDNLEPAHSQNIRHKQPHFSSFFKTVLGPYTTSFPPILITEEVYKGLKKTAPDEQSMREGWWTERITKIPEYSGKVYGADVIYTAAQYL